MKNQSKNIPEILKNAQKYSVSKEKDTQIIKELNSLKHNKPTPLIGDYFISLTNVIMSNYKKLAALAAMVALVVVVGLSGVLNSQTTYASHLENAEKALYELQVMQNEGADVDSAQVRELMQEMTKEMNAALALAEKEAEGEQKQKALKEVQSVQEKSLSMFKNYEGEENSSVEDAAKEMEQQQERVRKMLGEQSGEMVREQVQKEEASHFENAQKETQSGK